MAKKSRRKTAPRSRARSAKRAKQYTAAPAPQYYGGYPAASTGPRWVMWVGILATIIGAVSSVMYSSTFFAKYLPFMYGTSQLLWIVVTIVGLVMTYYASRRYR